MADLILPDSRLEMPSLFYPNRKPVGKVKIDWSNPLARGLKNVFCISGLDPKAPLTRGDYIADGSGSGYVVEDEMKWLRDTSAAEYSISFGIIPFDMTASSLVFSVFRKESGSWFDAENLAIWLDNSGYETGNSSILSFGAPNVPGSRIETSSGSVSEGVVNHITCSKKGDGLGSFSKAHIAGRLDTVVNDSARNLPSHEGGLARVGAAPYTLAFSHNANLKYLYIHDRVLSDVEIESLHGNPYEFLIPA